MKLPAGMGIPSRKDLEEGVAIGIGLISMAFLLIAFIVGTIVLAEALARALTHLAHLFLIAGM